MSLCLFVLVPCQHKENPVKTYLASAAVVIAAVAGTFCYIHESENEMSGLAKANARALALDGIEIGPLCIYVEKMVCHTFYDENPPLEIPGYEANM